MADSPLSSGVPAQLNRLVQHLAAAHKSFPASTLELARQSMTDIAGCMVSGWRDKAADAIGRYVMRQGGVEESTLWGQGVRVPAAQAAFAGAVSARAFEFGVVDCNAPGAQLKPLHAAETLVPVALAMAERCGSSGRETLAAYILGEDLAARLAAAMDFDQPLDCRGTVNTLCAAVVAGRLLGLDAAQYLAAFGLALHQLKGLRYGVQHSLGQGFSAQAGVMAAELAHMGLPGVVDPAASMDSLATAMQITYNPAALFDTLGVKFYSSVTFKPYPCCRAAHGAVDCMLELLRQGLTQDTLRQLRLSVSPWVWKHPVSRPFAVRQSVHGAAAYSLEYVLASTLLRGNCTLDCFTPEAIMDPAITALLPRLNLSCEDWPLHQDDGFLSTSAWAETVDGKVLHAHVRVPQGNECLGQGLSIEAKKHKFFHNLTYGLALPVERMERVWQQFLRLETLHSLRPLLQALHN